VYLDEDLRLRFVPVQIEDHSTELSDDD